MKSNNFMGYLKKRTRRIILMNAFRRFMLTLFMTTAAIYAVLAINYFFEMELPLYISRNVIFIIWLGIPAFVAFLTVLIHRGDIKRLIYTIQEHYPKLNDRLITAVEMSSQKKRGQMSGFSLALLQGLETEMTELLERFGFRRVSPVRSLLLPFFLFMLIGFFLFLHLKWQPDFFDVSFNRMTYRLSGEKLIHSYPKLPELAAFEIMVVPGDCEIPKGSNLFVQARAVGYEPQQVELYFKRKRESTWQIFPMERAETGEYYYTLTHVNEISSYYIKMDHRKSASFKIKIYESLEIERAIWKMNFPEYMNMPEQTKQGWRDKITVPRGTSLYLSLNMNRPVNHGWVLVDNEKKFALIPAGKKELVTNIVADDDMVLKLDVRSVDGDRLMNQSSLWVQTIPDLAPYLEVLEPQLKNYAFPTEEIPFKLSINDDYGISAVTAVVRYQEKEERIEWLPAGQNPDEMILEDVLDLERFQLESRDLVYVFLEIRDNYPNTEAHVVRSSLFTFFIRDYYEEFKLDQPDPKVPSLRSLVEDILVNQEEIMENTWDFASAFKGPKPTGWEAPPTDILEPVPPPIVPLKPPTVEVEK